jgi:hypothetical protein
MSWFRVHRLTRCRYGPRRSDEATEDGRGCHPFFGIEVKAQYLEATFPHIPQGRALASCTMANCRSLVPDGDLRPRPQGGHSGAYMNSVVLLRRCRASYTRCSALNPYIPLSYCTLPSTCSLNLLI